MKMLIAHSSGKNAKNQSVTFDTSREIFCYGRSKHDTFIYAEKKSDIDGIVTDLTKIGFVEVSLDEFEHGVAKVTTRSQMKELREGDAFFIKGIQHVACVDSHLCGDATCGEYVVYDEDGEGWFESDFPETA